MSNDSTATTLGMQPAAPASTPEPPAIASYDEAVSRKNAILNDPAARDRLLAGDIATNQEWRSIQQALAFGTQPPPSSPGDVEGMISHLRSRADIPEEVAAQIREGRPVSAHERQLAEEHKQKCFRDKAWVARYLDGGRHEATELGLINVVLSAPVRG